MTITKKMTKLPRRQSSRWRFGTRTAKNFKGRLISVGNGDYIDPPPELEQDSRSSRRGGNLPQTEFVGNQVKSSRYTVLTFVPK